MFYRDPHFEVNSDKEFFAVVHKTRKDEKKVNGWSLNGKCIHCNETQCHIYKFGRFAINIANANRQGNTKKEREKLLLSFYDGYHNASQYMRFINGGYPRQQITEDDIDSLPHCCYRLMDNWLHNIKATSIKESGDNHESNIKRQRTK